MLTQKMTKELLLYVVGKGEKKNITKTEKVFDITLKALKDGGNAPLDLNMTKFQKLPKPDDKKVKEKLALVSKIWSSFKYNLEGYLKEKNEKYLSYIIENNTKLLSEMNKAVFLMQNVADKKVKLVRTIQKIAIVIGIFLAAVSIVMATKVSTNIKILTENVQKMAGGDMTVEVFLTVKDEVGKMGDEITKCVRNLRNILGKVFVQSHGTHVSTITASTYSKSLSKAVEKLGDISEKVYENTVNLIEDIERLVGEMDSISFMTSNIMDFSHHMEKSVENTTMITKDLISMIGHVSESFKDLSESLKAFSTHVSNVDIASESVKEVGGDVLERIKETTSAVEGISASIEEVSSAISEQSASIEEVARNAKEAEAISDKVVDKAINGKERLALFVEAVKRISNEMDGLRSRISDLSQWHLSKKLCLIY